MPNHQAIALLIPWYVNGTLNENETDRVSEHVSECARCAAAVEAEMQLSQGLRIPPSGLSKLEAHEQSGFASLLMRMNRADRHRSPLWLGAAAVLLLAISSVAFLGGRYSQDVSFEAMTRESMQDRPVLQLIFHPETTERDLRLLILDSNGALLGGPSTKGVYRLALPMDVDAGSYADRLRLHPALRWVEVELH